MDKNDFVSMAIGDLVQPEKVAPVSDSKAMDSVVEMAIGDLTGRKSINETKPVEVNAPDYKSIDLEEAFNKSVATHDKQLDEIEETKDTLAKDIADLGASVLEKTLRGLR